MPVDPGNLLLVGELDGRPVLGAPGCARSPAENGFDWVLKRILAGLEVSESDITGMGVGGLLMEIVSRPQPREPAAEPRRASPRSSLPPASRAAWAGRTSSSRASTASRSSAASRATGARLEGRARHRRHRPPRRGDRRPRSTGSTSASSTIPTSPTVSRPRSRRALPPCRRAQRRAGAPRRHARHRPPNHGPADRRVPRQAGAGDRASDRRRQARQPGAVGARLLPRTDER